MQAVYLLIYIALDAVGNQLFVPAVDETGKPGVLPHLLQPVAAAVAGAVAVLCHKLTAGVAGSAAVCAVVVVIGYVIVPKRSPIQMRVVLLLIEICGKEAIDICGYLGADIPVGKRRGIHHWTVAVNSALEIR